MIDNAGVLHVVQSIRLILPLVVELLLVDLADHAPADPGLGIIFLDWLLLFDFLVVIGVQTDLDRHVLHLDDALGVDVELLGVLHVQRDRVSDVLREDPHVDWLELSTSIHSHLRESGLEHKEDHGQEERREDKQLNEQPLEGAALEADPVVPRTLRR